LGKFKKWRLKSFTFCSIYKTIAEVSAYYQNKDACKELQKAHEEAAIGNSRKARKEERQKSDFLSRQKNIRRSNTLLGLCT